ncbi:DUF5060 domain-containing protein [Mucilaginibacter ginsenosidivorans]|uniref:DUF5060 domain-containing protein n=1 Tax=Mucilaginibacter ginsenosidivorans TaxID=398053 RepID=A0A5B8V202_9SPHI|nr:DUF5060 domain-containing protein [Mucilaginibacter ginsenosidivorans]QEC65282.1 DUF5060 domain-containing protein [Mucilaginibacter ginsenosidivorans]
MKAAKTLIFLYFAALMAFTSYAQPGIADYKLTTGKVKEYQKAEWNIHISAPFNNAYDQADISLNMVMTSPSGKPIVLPCYYESGDEKASLWKARFAPQEVGRYEYHFVLHTSGKGLESANGSFIAEPGSEKGFLHKNNLWTFKYDNGELFRGIGENVGWESRSFEKDKWTYDYLLPKLSGNDANFFRTWMCYWNLPLEWKKVHSTKRYSNSDAYYNPGAIKRMDELVNLTDSLNLKFMLTMDWHGHLMEEGGWKNSNYNAANGGPAKTPTEYFTSQKARAMYKNKLRYIVARWGYSTSIAAFEFFNEIDNAAFNGADSVLIPLHYITEWHDEMSRYLKDIDPYGHLVTTSVSHRDIPGMNSIAYIDFNQKHIYKHTDKIPGIYWNYINGFGKPYVVGEFGYRWEDDDRKYAVEADYDFKRGLWYGLFSPCPILPMSWWWEMFDEQNMEPYFKGLRQISDEMLRAGKGSFEQFPVSSGDIEAYGVKCGNKYFIYLLNNTDATVSTPVSFAASDKNYTISYFDPNDQSIKPGGKLAMQAGKIVIGSFRLPAKKEKLIVVTAN